MRKLTSEKFYEKTSLTQKPREREGPSHNLPPKTFPPTSCIPKNASPSRTHKSRNRDPLDLTPTTFHKHTAYHLQYNDVSFFQTTHCRSSTNVQKQQQAKTNNKANNNNKTTTTNYLCRAGHKNSIHHLSQTYHLSLHQNTTNINNNNNNNNESPYHIAPSHPRRTRSSAA